MATLEEILEEIGDEKAAIVKSAIEQEKNRGIEGARKKGEDVKKFMTESNKLKDAIRKLNIDPSGNVEEQIEELQTKLSKMSSESEGGNEQLKALQRELAKISQKLETAEREKEETRKKYVNTKISESLVKAFGDSIYGVDLVVKNLINDGAVKLADNDRIVFLNGDEELDLEDGVTNFKKTRSDLVKNNQNNGSGGSQTQTQNKKTMPVGEFEKMNIRQKAEFFKNGGEVK